MNREQMTNGEVVTHGAVGTAATLGGWILSHTQQMNGLLQTCSLIVGLSIGGITLFRLITRNQTKE